MVWTIIVLGIITALVFPFLRDLVSRAVLALMYFFHFVTVYLIYDYIPHSDYIVIGLFAVIEVICLLLPMAWLELRQTRLNTAAATGHQADVGEKKN